MTGGNWLRDLRQRFEKFLSGSRPADPLYLSNRTWKDKLRPAAWIAGPVALLIVLMVIGFLPHSRPADSLEHALNETIPALAEEPSPAPKLTPKDFEVVDLRILRDQNPPMIAGLVRNNTNRSVSSVEVSYYLAAADGSKLATERMAVQNLQPHQSVPFQAPLTVDKAEYALVREVRQN